MDAMQIATYAGLLLVGAAGHGVILRFAVRLMVNVSLSPRDACLIIGAEYAIAAAVTGLAQLAGDLAWQVPATLACAGLLITGAVLIGRRVALPSGHTAGVGNGILIQFMQVPLLIPFAILLSFLVVPPF